MKQVSEGVIENVLRRMENIVEEEVPKLVEQMGKEQPLVLAYLLAHGGEKTEEEQGFLIFLGLNVWLIMSEGERHPLIENQ